MAHTPDTVSPIAHYLKDLAELGEPHSVPNHILQQGREFPSQELTPVELDFIANIAWDQRAEKQCYYNAQIEALTLPSSPGITLRYAEGYVDPGLGIAVEHAWLSVNGKVVDPTIRLRTRPTDRVIGTIPDAWGYYGVEMDPEECRHVLVHGASAPLIDDPECGWPKIPGRNQRTRRRRPSTTKPRHQRQEADQP